MTQSQALAIMKTGVNVYLTGSAGSGKTHTLRQYIDWLDAHSIPVAITASTGIAATHMNGMTIHGWSGIGIREKLDEYDLEQLTEKQYLYKRFEKARVLIIDEVSMLHAHRLDMVERVCRKFKRSDLPFGGLQVVLSGDFFQLPPVTRTGVVHAPQPKVASQQHMFEEVTIDYDTGEEVFEEPELELPTDNIVRSNAWRVMKPAICYLTEQHRQEDDAFLDILNAIRQSAVSGKHLDTLQSRMNADIKAILPTKLYTHNVDVDAINYAALASLGTQEKQFTMSGKGNDILIDILKKSCLAPEELRLKEGAEVMFIKNNYELGYANGTRGVVAGFDAGGSPIVKVGSTGERITAAPEEWQVEENGKVKASITQYPLRLAWAITIHKSQGMSLDAAEIDLSKTFAYGMGYVALSRVRTLAGVRLVGFQESSLQVDPAVLKLDEKLQKESEENVALFSKLSKDEQEKLENEYILRAGGKILVQPKAEKVRLGKKGKPLSEAWSAKMTELRKEYPKAYTPWEALDDEQLGEKFQRGLKIETIARELGRQPGSIKARLVKFGLIDDDYKKEEK